MRPAAAWFHHRRSPRRGDQGAARRGGVGLDGRGGSWQLTNGEGGDVRWGRDGREQFFVAGTTLTRGSLAVRGDELTIGQAEPLFEVPSTPMESSLRDYDYDPVHDRFLFTRPPKGNSERREIALSLGWAQRLKSRLGEKQGERN